MPDLSELSFAPPSVAPPVVSPGLLADIQQAASECNKCSLCQAVCPTYVVNPVEWESARGRVSLVRDVIEGRIELRDIEDGPLSTCLTCDNCVSACAPAVPTAHIVSRARQELYARDGLPGAVRLLTRVMLARPLLRRTSHAVTRAADRVGLGNVVRRTGVTRWMGTPGSGDVRIRGLSRRTAHDRVRHLPPVAAPVRGRVGFIVCCTENFVAPEATEATMRVLLANGYEIVVPQVGCVGQPARRLGDRAAMIDMGATTAAALDTVEVDSYVGDTEACIQHVRQLGEILTGDRVHQAAATRTAERTLTATDFLAREGWRAPLGSLRWTVAIDIPCATPHGGGEPNSMAELLRRIPNLNIVPLTEATMCCGGLNGYHGAERARSDAILKRKFEHVIASGARVLVTADVWCLGQLREGAAQFAPNVRVMHVFEVLDAAIESARRRTAVPSRP